MCWLAFLRGFRGPQCRHRHFSPIVYGEQMLRSSAHDPMVTPGVAVDVNLLLPHAPAAMRPGYYLRTAGTAC
jgi:hypothetical protein